MAAERRFLDSTVASLARGSRRSVRNVTSTHRPQVVWTILRRFRQLTLSGLSAPKILTGPVGLMATADKRTFWAYFFQALAGAEAGLNPNASVRRDRSEVALAMRSEGLLQLAYADQKRYGCDFNSQVDRALKANDPAKTILQPKNNLECGVKILVHQTIVRHKSLLSQSGYCRHYSRTGRAIGYSPSR